MPRFLGLMLILALLTTGFPAQAQGSTYYVAPNGVDTVPGGTSGHPWRTLQFAVDHVDPGDIILVRSGTYVGCRIQNSGTAAAWITLQAAPGAQVLVNAPGPDNVHGSNVEVETWDGAVAYWVIAGLEVANAPSWGIDVRGSENALAHHITVRGCTVHHNGLTTGRTGIFLAFVDYTLVEYNESYSNGEHGIYYSNSGDYPIIRGNVLHHNANCGLHMNGDASMGNDGVISYGLVERNVVYENGTGGGSGLNMDGVTHTVVRNNLLYDNHASGISLYQIDGGSGSQDNRVLNNTIVVPADGRWAINIPDANDTGNQITNNIIYSYHSWRGCILIPTPGLTGLQSDYNVVLDRFSTDGGDTRIGLAAWQALGYDAHSFIATPDQLFVDPAGDDYHLQADSPAIDAGAVLPDVVDDLAGQPRPVGPAWDMGAYEYQGYGFALTAMPTTQVIDPGHATTYTLHTAPLGAFSPTITLTHSPAPPSLTMNLSPDAIAPGAGALLAVTDTHAVPLWPGLAYTIYVTGTGGSATAATVVYLQVGGLRLYLPLVLKA
ncbi:MAG: right-handed parallel beta-helix repeat-containing protein [Chloroflexi bacterium]|nr:right-handed parallel beta-helix repeat-containing protein [Chloroflexota bacterium]